MTICSIGRTNHTHLFLFIGLSLIFFACRKNEDSVSADVLAQRSPFGLQYIDTTTIIAFNAVHDSFPTSRLSAYVLGEMNDAVFGYSNAQIVTQFSTNTNWPTNQNEVDSIVLQIPFGVATPNGATYYGDLSYEHFLKVYELNEILSPDSSYFSNRRPSYDVTKPIGSWQGRFNLTDQVEITYNGVTTTLNPHIRIKLDNSDFIQKFIEAGKTGGFASNQALQAVLKGLVIGATKGQGAPDQGNFAYILKSGLFAVVAYYNGTERAEFPVSTETITTNYYSHQRSPNIVFNAPFSTVHSDRNYLQGTAGSKMRILFPYLFNYVKDNEIALSGAELVVTAEEGSFNSTIYQLPTNLRLLASDSLGRNDFIADAFLGENYYGGRLNSFTNEYRFNITRHMQGIFNAYKASNSDINYGLNLMVTSDNPISAGRVILDTRRSSPTKIKLILSYTVIK